MMSVLTCGLLACDEIETVSTTDNATAEAGPGGSSDTTDAGKKPSGDKPGNGGGIEIPDEAGPGGTMLAAGVVGTKCAMDTDCKGSNALCSERLNGGALGQLIGGSPPTGGYCSASCMSDEDCGEGGLCFGYYPQFGSGECRKPCTKDADCGREDYECSRINMPPLTVGNGQELMVPDTCQPKTIAVKFTDQVGKACTADADCGGGRCALSGSFPGGYCTGGCYEDSDCGSGGICRGNIYGGGGDCFEGCSVDSDCARDAQGYGCLDADGVKLCAAKADPLPDGVVGSACEDDTTCGGGVCAERVGAEQVATPGGYCSSIDCVEDAQCGAGGVCSPTMGRTRCYKGCAETTECREGYECIPRGDDQRLVCFPKVVEEMMP